MFEQGTSIFQQNNRDARPLTSELGDKGELIAVEYLEKLGLKPVMTNFKVPVGRNSRGAQVTGEIDIIALDGETLCFIEVKTRSSGKFGGPLSAVDLAKQRQITRTAKIYRQIFRLNNIDFRYDVVTVLLEPGKRPKLEYVRSFWKEDKFRKKKWTGSEIFF